MPGLFAYKLVAYKMEGYIQNIAIFPLLEVMLNASILFTITFLLTVVQRNESDFLLCFIIHSCFFVPFRLSYKQLLKNT